MSKIVNIRLPASATTSQPTPQDFNQLKEAVQQIVLQLNTSYTPVTSENTVSALSWALGGGASAAGGFSGHVRGFQDSVGMMLPYGMFMDSNDQTNPSTTAANTLRLNTPIFGSGIRVEDDTKLYFDYPGQYEINVSCQVVNSTNDPQEFELWAVNTGTNYPLSNTRFDVPRRKNPNQLGHIAAAISGIFTVNDPVNEYLEMAWWAESTNVYIENYPARTNPTRPEIPSVILTAKFLSAETNDG
jgi:hypothetical protein